MNIRSTTLSFIDYPGNIVSTVFLGGCDFRCGFCHNPELIRKGSSMAMADIISNIKTRKLLLDGVCLTGGEPLLSDIGKLSSFIDEIKGLGMKVKLDTNGSHPDKLKELLPRLDFVAMDIKTSKDKYRTAINKNADFKKISESIGLVMGLENYEFRTTAVPGIVELEDILEIGKMLKGAKRFVLQRFVPDKTYNPRFKKLKPHDDDFFEKAKKIMEGYVTEVLIR